MNKKSVLVTGGAGFLGSHLCDELLKKNYKVFCLDNLYSGQLKNINKFSNESNFTFIEQDICDLEFNYKIDQVYNLACPASPIHYQADPVKTIKTNFLGSINVLEIAKKNKAKILQASTSEVYGDPSISPQSEQYWGNVNPIGIRSCYDEGKRASETLFFDFHRQFNMEIKVCRIFNTYGPCMAQNDGRVISNFIIQALKNKSLNIYGDGYQTRSFCYVNDLIKGLIQIMDTSNTFTGPINLGNDAEIRIKDIADKIIGLTKSKSNINYIDPVSDDPMQRKPDLTLAKNTIGWNPEVTIDDGINLTIDYFKKELKI